MRKLAYFAAVALLCTGIAVAQSTSSPDQNPSSSPAAQQPSSTAPSGTAADQNQASPSTGAATTSDQNAQAPADQTGNAKAGKKLPQTASPLPFLSLLGMGLIGAGSLKNRVGKFFNK
ncbi:MAG TPA: hypothetical protein VFU86_23785 [Terriglobales bacterium]|nr:hypothetical protein [Terriglobales bacterium]